jgi:hypothetical protein
MYKLYKLPDGTYPKIVLRVADNAFIPFDLANGEYQQYLAWLEAGNQPLPADEVTQ